MLIDLTTVLPYFMFIIAILLVKNDTVAMFRKPNSRAVQPYLDILKIFLFILCFKYIYPAFDI